VPCTKFVFWPTMATLANVSPCCPLFGVTDVIEAGASATVKALVIDTTCVPVVRVTDRPPSVALLCTVMFAVALNALFTVRLFTVIPAPKSATVVPFTNAVF
jgi:hypothetical protein